MKRVRFVVPLLVASLLMFATSAKGFGVPSTGGDTDPEPAVKTDTVATGSLEIESVVMNEMLSSLVINFSLRQRAQVHLQVMNASGETVVNYDVGAYPEGNANLFVDVARLHGGDYLCRLQADDLVATQLVSIPK
jgi:hypothetical protein